MALERVGKSIERYFDAAGLSRPLRGWMAIDVWPDVVGERVARRARPTGFQEGRLVVEVDSPAWVSELGYLKRDLIVKINQRLGEAVIREIQFVAARGGRG